MMKRRFITALAGLAGLLAASASHPVLAQEVGAIRISMDQARILKLDRNVSKAIIGNSNVADVTVADAKTIVLTGRSFGATNLVLLDAAGNAIVDERVLVSLDEEDSVRVYEQTQRRVMSCTPSCEEYTPGNSGSSAAP